MNKKAPKARKVEFAAGVGAQPDAALLERLKREIAQSGLNGQMIRWGREPIPIPDARAGVCVAFGLRGVRWRWRRP
ncbi:MAG: hypothetical protein ACLUI3_04200 [Christensenellales bacterium]